MTYYTSARSLLLACVLASSLAGFVRADNWPQWRGPANDGVSTETNLPTRWGQDENIAWSLPMPGMAGSTPIVWDDRIFLTSADGNNDLWILCVSTAGKTLWKHKLGNARVKTMGNEGNGASASPSTDGKHVWAFVGSGDFTCFTLDGKEIWHFNAQERYGKFRIQFGMHTTPVLYGDRLYMQLIHSGGARVIALNKNTGKTVWNVARPSDGVKECEHSYASPCVWHDGGKAYLITHGNDYAIAHRLEDGREIWRVGDLNPKNRYNYTLR
ncbi:MAG TPA: PQQ-binding-like beta-propeller repeat protein, partial [Gemmataceae bacterium]